MPIKRRVVRNKDQSKPQAQHLKSLLEVLSVDSRPQPSARHTTGLTVKTELLERASSLLQPLESFVWRQLAALEGTKHIAFVVARVGFVSELAQ